jgi:hypothetical protein
MASSRYAAADNFDHAATILNKNGGVQGASLQYECVCCLVDYPSSNDHE